MRFGFADCYELRQRLRVERVRRWVLSRSLVVLAGVVLGGVLMLMLNNRLGWAL